LEHRYEQFGWKDDDSFLFGTQLYTHDSIRRVAVSDAVRSRSEYLGPRVGGSVAGWSSAANQLFALGFETQAFALLSSFAAPLMRLHLGGEGGAIINLVGNKMDFGKTVALAAGASVWGRPKGTQLGDDDANLKGATGLSAIGNIACTYDRLYNRDPEVIRRFVMMFTDGKDRGSAQKLQHIRGEWPTILLLSSDKSIVDILNSMDGPDASVYRVLEFVLDTPETMDKARTAALSQQLEINAGHAADLYLRTLLQPQILNYLGTALPKWAEEIWNKTGATKEMRFWGKTLASMIGAATVVRHAGILDFSIDRISGWAIEQVQQKISHRGEFSGRRTAISMLISFLNQHLIDTMVVPSGWKPGPNKELRILLEPRRNLLIRHELADNKVFVDKVRLSEWLEKSGVHEDGFYQELKEDGILLFGRRVATLGAGTRHSAGQRLAAIFMASHPAMQEYLDKVEEFVPRRFWKKARG
jgi:hypothetical protein